MIEGRLSKSTPQQQIDADALRLLVESTIDYAIFMLDPRGFIASWNAGAERIKGYTADEIVGQHFSVFYPAEAVNRGWPEHELKEAVRVGRFEDEGWRVRKDGSQFWANVIITALRGPDGTLRGFAKVTRDITERRAHVQRIEALTQQLEQRLVELARTNRELQHKSAENENFVYSVSHDVRSPLVNLQGFSQELLLTSESLAALLAQPGVPEPVREEAATLIDGELRESITFIRNAVRHLSNIIDGLLRLSRVGRVEYQSETVDLNGVVANLLSAMHGSIGSSGANVVVKRLPTVTGDSNAIGQIFANILGNALKCFDQARPGTIEIDATDDDPPVIRIRDNGIGIPAEYRGKVFQPFQSVHLAEKIRGEGMGLAIVQRIVERHGGRIWFESSPGEGTTFFFTLASASRPPAAAPAPRA